MNKMQVSITLPKQEYFTFSYIFKINKVYILEVDGVRIATATLKTILGSMAGFSEDRAEEIALHVAASRGIIMRSVENRGFMANYPWGWSFVSMLNLERDTLSNEQNDNNRDMLCCPLSAYPVDHPELLFSRWLPFGEFGEMSANAGRGYLMAEKMPF